MSILHIDSSARIEASNSRRISDYIVGKIRETEQGGGTVIRRDLAADLLPQINAEDLIDLHASSLSDRVSLKVHIDLSNNLIEELAVSDSLVIGVPIYNFGVPLVLKQWLDYVARAGKTFRYTDSGPVGLTDIKQAYVVISSGGTALGSPMDHVGPYLKTVLGFLGVEVVHIIDAGGSKGAPEKIISDAKAQVDGLFSA